MERPTGVTVLAILSFLGCGIFLLGGAGFMLMGAGGAMVGAKGGSSGMGAMLAGLGVIGGIIMLFFAVIYGAMGFGLWTLKNWARTVCIVLTGLGLLVQLLGAFRSLIHFNIFSVIWAALWIAIDVLIIWYLREPEVRKAFGAETSAI